MGKSARTRSRSYDPACGFTYSFIAPSLPRREPVGHVGQQPLARVLVPHIVHCLRRKCFEQKLLGLGARKPTRAQVKQLVLVKLRDGCPMSADDVVGKNLELG